MRASYAPDQTAADGQKHRLRGKVPDLDHRANSASTSSTNDLVARSGQLVGHLSGGAPLPAAQAQTGVMQSCATRNGCEMVHIAALGYTLSLRSGRVVKWLQDATVREGDRLWPLNCSLLISP